jgi:tripartite-type tricarboxylate transporter receptor subunit TctC
MIELGLVPKSGPPEEMAARLQSDIAKWTKVIADAHIPKL